MSFRTTRRPGRPQRYAQCAWGDHEALLSELDDAIMKHLDGEVDVQE